VSVSFFLSINFSKEPVKRKQNSSCSTNSAKRKRLSKNNHSQTQDQNMVEDEINVNYIISIESSLAKVLKETRFIVRDELTIANKSGPEAFNRTFTGFRADERPLGGVVVLFAGNFRQILPVVPSWGLLTLMIKLRYV